MTLNEYIQYLTKNNCNIQPIEGRNLTGRGVKITNLSNQRTHHLQIYHDGNNEMSDKTIMLTCDDLWLKYPPHLDDTTNTILPPRKPNKPSKN